MPSVPPIAADPIPAGAAAPAPDPIASGGGSAQPSAPTNAPAQTDGSATSSASAQASAGAASIDDQITAYSSKVMSLQTVIEQANQQASEAIKQLGQNGQPSPTLQTALLRLDVFNTLLDIDPTAAPGQKTDTSSTPADPQATPGAQAPGKAAGSGTADASTDANAGAAAGTTAPAQGGGAPAGGDPTAVLVKETNAVTTAVQDLVQQGQALAQTASADKSLSKTSAQTLGASLQIVHKAQYAALAADAAQQQLEQASKPAGDGSAQQGQGQAAPDANGQGQTQTQAPTNGSGAASAPASPVDVPGTAASTGATSALGALAAADSQQGQQAAPASSPTQAAS